MAVTKDKTGVNCLVCEEGEIVKQELIFYCESCGSLYKFLPKKILQRNNADTIKLESATGWAFRHR